jgi:hypothetical protein
MDAAVEIEVEAVTKFVAEIARQTHREAADALEAILAAEAALSKKH